MKLAGVLTLGLLFSGGLLAQNRAEPDSVETQCGALVIQPIVHGTVVVMHEDVVLYVDPYGGAASFVGLPKATHILITDIHGDHLNAETLEALDTEGVTFVVPAAVQEKLPESLRDRTVVVLANGKKKKVDGVKIEAIPMYNLPETEDSRHPKGRGNGYVVTLCDQRIYFSGDTEDIAEMRALKKIDIAFVCMNLPYTMDIHQAASAVLEFKPKVVYPYHYRGQEGLSDVEEFSEQVNEGGHTEVRLRSWYSE